MKESSEGGDYQNGDLVKYLYDQGRRLTSSETKNKNNAILQSFGWGYDALDLKSFEKRIHNGGKGDAFSYDALKRLTNVTFDSPTPETPTVTGTKSRAITLDKLDNILKITDNENAMVTEIIGELEGKGKALNQYSKFNDLPLEYDTNGNLSAKGSRLFAYDYRNRLVRSSKGDDAVTFTYDIFGRQTSRTDVSGTQHFFYAGDQKIEERNASGQVTKHYLWGNGIDELLRLDIYNGSSLTPYYVHTDNIGSTTAITDSSGNLVERVTYDVYGAPTFTDALGQTLKKSTIRNTTLFQGREYDYDLALYNYRARYLDPSLGRFLQPDPLGYQDSMNLYQGMNMNPVNFTDPMGEFSLKFKTIVYLINRYSKILDPGPGKVGFGLTYPPFRFGENGEKLISKDVLQMNVGIVEKNNSKYLSVDLVFKLNVYVNTNSIYRLFPTEILSNNTAENTLRHELEHLSLVNEFLKKKLKNIEQVPYKTEVEIQFAKRQLEKDIKNILEAAFIFSKEKLDSLTGSIIDVAKNWTKLAVEKILKQPVTPFYPILKGIEFESIEIKNVEENDVLDEEK